ncbi:MAG: tetratricopeptide repeat protein [Lachnospiraceae bacterium]|nr:tetratricopeptide repeat protein [Lachnospiraceae bacterium]
MFSGCSLKPGEYTELGMESLENSDYQAALDFFDEALENDEDKGELYRGRGIAKMGLYDYKGAIEDFRASLSESGGNVSELEFDTAFYLATAQFKNGDVQGAIDTYSAIIGLDEDNADAFFLRGKAELANDDYDSAADDFDMAIQYNPTDPDLYISIYESLESTGHSEEGSGYLKDAMELNNINEYQKGRLYYWLGDYDNAKGCLEEANDTKADPGVVLYLGKTYEALGDKSYAASLYSSYLTDNPSDANICNQLGICQLESGQYEAALAAFRQGLGVTNNQIMQSLRYNEIVAYEYLSDFKQASVLMAEYIKDYPEDEAAKREQIFLASR